MKLVRQWQRNRKAHKEKTYAWKVEFPEDCKDANDVLIKYGRDGIDKIVTGCKPWPVAGLYDASHFYDQVDEIYEKGMGKGESTGTT